MTNNQGLYYSYINSLWLFFALNHLIIDIDDYESDLLVIIITLPGLFMDMKQGRINHIDTDTCITYLHTIPIIKILKSYTKSSICIYGHGLSLFQLHVLHESLSELILSYANLGAMWPSLSSCTMITQYYILMPSFRLPTMLVNFESRYRCFLSVKRHLKLSVTFL